MDIPKEILQKAAKYLRHNEYAIHGAHWEGEDSRFDEWFYESLSELDKLLCAALVRDVQLDPSFEKLVNQGNIAYVMAEEIRSRILDLAERNRGTTHYEGCEKVHPDCAVLESLSAALDLYDAWRETQEMAEEK